MSLEHGQETGQYEEAPEWYTRSRGTRFVDGCHRYNWIITPLLSAILSALMFAYFIGRVEANVASLKEDVMLLQREVFALAHPGNSGVQDK